AARSPLSPYTPLFRRLTPTRLQAPAAPAAYLTPHALRPGEFRGPRAANTAARNPGLGTSRRRRRPHRRTAGLSVPGHKLGAMVCLTCRKLGSGGLCESCRMELRPAAHQYVEGVGVVAAAYRHEGPARLLVHHLKYRGIVRAGTVLAGEMSRHVEDDVTLVPVPRLTWRLLR